MTGIFIGFMGLFIGSFLNVCIYRIPRKESIVLPPSHCPHCSERLKAWDLIPVLSYLLCRGRCRYCGEKISPQYLLLEVITGLVYYLTYLQFGLTGEGYMMLAFVSALIVVTGIDARHRIIPDKINLPGIAIGFMLAIFQVHITFLNALAGFLVGGGLFLLILIITRGGMGAGDMKFMAFVGTFLGIRATLLTIFLGSLIGSFYGLYLVLIKKAGLKTAVPYGPFLAAGAFLAALYGEEIVRLYLQLVLR